MVELVPFNAHRPVGSRIAALTALLPPLCPDERPWGCLNDAAHGWPSVLRGLGQGESSSDSIAAAPWLAHDEHPHFAVYRIVKGSHTVIGIIGLVRVSELLARIDSHEVPSTAPTHCVRCRLAIVHGVQLDAAVILVEHADRLPLTAERALGDRPRHHFIGPEQITHTLWAVTPAPDIVQWGSDCQPLRIATGHALFAARVEAAGPDALTMVHFVVGSVNAAIPSPRGGMVAWIDRPAP
ncbi:MAG: hypothetical protein O2819_01050 [Planctomycetota bacterium]|nr:hypothetical protein [Planctomycetota bacterium]MDA1105630.1 hypothetical protein [Planctomycetota bacterium]